MNELQYLHTFFPKDPNSGNFIIEVALGKYIYAFNEWDSSYFKRRDLDRDLIHFLESFSNDIPLKYDLDLLFTVFQEKDSEMENLLRDNIKNYFIYSSVWNQRYLKRLYWKVARYVILAVLFITLGNLLGPGIAENPLGKAFREGLLVGSWVFLWEGISLWSFNRFGIKQKIREYQRLSNANIRFKYDNSTNEASDSASKEKLLTSEDFPGGSSEAKKEAINQSDSE